MDQRRLWFSAAIITIIIVVGFVLSVPRTKDVGFLETSEDGNSEVQTVSLHDSFKKGKHTIEGSILVPNACTVLDATAALATGVAGDEQILISISMSEDVGVCLQLPTEMNFSVNLEAPGNLPIAAIVNGKQASTTML